METFTCPACHRPKVMNSLFFDKYQKKYVTLLDIAGHEYSETTQEFHRIRIGIQPSVVESGLRAENYVLRPFTEDEMTRLPEIFKVCKQHLITVVENHRHSYVL